MLRVDAYMRGNFIRVKKGKESSKGGRGGGAGGKKTNVGRQNFVLVMPQRKKKTGVETRLIVVCVRSRVTTGSRGDYGSVALAIGTSTSVHAATSGSCRRIF